MRALLPVGWRQCHARARRQRCDRRTCGHGMEELRVGAPKPTWRSLPCGMHDTPVTQLSSSFPPGPTNPRGTAVVTGSPSGIREVQETPRGLEARIFPVPFFCFYNGLELSSGPATSTLRQRKKCSSVSLPGSDPPRDLGIAPSSMYALNLAGSPRICRRWRSLWLMKT